MKRIVVILLFILFFMAVFCHCSKKEADLEQVDILIRDEQYDQALTLLKQQRMLQFSDTTQYDRINHRIFNISKHLFFEEVDRIIEQEDWIKAQINLERIKSKIDTMAKHSSRKYLFDYYLRKSQIDSHSNRLDLWAWDLEKALEYPSPDVKKIFQHYRTLAFYYAEKGEYDKARQMLDNSFRKMALIGMRDDLKAVFYSYMNGDFEKSLNLLESMPDSLKNNHWKSLEKFLSTYAIRLTKENRFNLW